MQKTYTHNHKIKDGFGLCRPHMAITHSFTLGNCAFDLGPQLCSWLRPIGSLQVPSQS